MKMCILNHVHQRIQKILKEDIPFSIFFTRRITCAFPFQLEFIFIYIEPAIIKAKKLEPNSVTVNEKRCSIENFLIMA